MWHADEEIWRTLDEDFLKDEENLPDKLHTNASAELSVRDEVDRVCVSDDITSAWTGHFV